MSGAAMIGRLKRTLRLRTRYRRLAEQARTLGGVRNLLQYQLHRVRQRTGIGGREFLLRHARGAVSARGGTTDLAVFEQIFIDEEYAPLADLLDVRLVIDCGANVGYSTAYLLSRWPEAAAVAVEPDAGNFALLRRNLAPFGARATTMQAGVWSHPCGLVMAEGSYRGGGAWARQVREATVGEAMQIRGVDIESLLAASGQDRVTLLKVDIEGAECVVFAGTCGWLDRVDAIAIELHDDTAFGRGTDVFHRALRGRGFLVSRYGELTICRRDAPSNGAG